MSNQLSAAKAQLPDDELSYPHKERKHHFENGYEAALVLLKSVGCPESGTSTSLATLAKKIDGSGFSLDQHAIVNQTIPAFDDMLGSVVQLSDGSWLAVLGCGDDAVCLNKDGVPQGSLDDTTCGKITDCWTLTERVLNLRSIKPFFQRYRSHFIDLFIAALIVNLFGLTMPLFSSFVYDKILGNGIIATLWALVIGLGLIIGIEFCVRIIRINVAERFAVGSEVEIDYATFRSLIDTKANKLPSLGAALEKYKQILSYRDFLSSSYILAMADVPFLLLFLAAIAIAAGPLVMVPIICGGLLLLSSLTLTAPVLDYDRVGRANSEKRFGLMTDILNAREAIIGSHLRNKLGEHWRQASVAAVQATSKSRYWRTLGLSVAGSLSSISFVAVIVGGVYMVEDHMLTSGGLLAASLLTSRCMAVFSSIVTLVLRYREFRLALRELNQIMPLAKYKSAAKHHGHLRGDVRLDRVTCRVRKDNTPVLNEINLHFRPGEIVGIAGAPGAGKTTLLRLIAGVIDPDEGRVLIDNIPIEDLSPEDISRNIGFKPQEFCLLDGTIEDNVRAGHPPMTTEQRRDVLIASGLLRPFEEGSLHWLSDVGPRGSHLSGGQRQMVSLARAFLTQAPLILLDEPTNGLDAVLENHLASQIAALRQRSTVLVSTHSRNVLTICDRIIVVGQGRILADGPSKNILV